MPSESSSPILTRQTLQDGIFLKLREALMSGQFVPGMRLTAREIAESMGTSVMPVREAFRRLTALGALEPLSTGATRVPLMDPGKIADIMEVRMQVEGLAARRAATRITAEQFRILGTANDDMLAAMRRKEPNAEARANEQFHFCIYSAAGSEELLRVIEHLWLRIGPYLFALLEEERKSGDSRTRRPATHHAAILEAMRLHDPDKAETALRADLMGTASFFAGRPRQPSRSSA
jgi:DNA-binding GntR family transcriptional regulator